MSSQHVQLSVICLAAAAAVLPAQEAVGPLPVIDMHLHALAASDQGPPPVGLCSPFPHFPPKPRDVSNGEHFARLLKQPPCDDPLWSPSTDEELKRQTLAVMERRNVYGVLSGTRERVADWRAEAPERFVAGLVFNVASQPPTPEELRELHAQGELEVLGEITNQYAGIAPDDPQMDPYWSLAEELDLPVGIHVGTGPPGVAYFGAPEYRGRLHSALTLEEVLVRHPKLRLYVMHAGYPMLDDMLTVLYTHPQVYVGIGVIVYTQPRAAFYRYLRSLVEAGFGKRVMFGSDQIVWPGAIERGIAVIEEAPFLDEQQKRDILYHNAARFLDLSDETIAQHHETETD